MDLLGQRQAIRQLGAIPLSEDNRPELVGKLKASLGALTLFRDAVLPFVDKLINHEPATGFQNLSPDQKKIYWSLRTSRLKTWTFSDTVVAYAPIVNAEATPAVRDLYSIFVTCATTMLLLLSAGMPVRGAIEMGVALEPRDGEIYGPAFVDAYDLHEVVAGYPRVVVGDKLGRHLHQLLEYPGDGDVPSLIRENARLCASIVKQDQDGMLFVDYLGTGFREIIGGSHYDDLVKKAREFVDTEHEGQIKARDWKLAGRYACLRQYFDARASEWEGEQQRN